jgi:copper chaperone CopZ
VQAALKSVKGVSKATVGSKVGDKANAVVTAEKSVKIDDLIKALKKKGYTANEKKDA